MKRLYAITLVLVLGCSGEEPTPPTTPDTPPTAQPATQPGTQPAADATTRPTSQPTVLSRYEDVVRQQFPNLPQEPPSTPARLEDAAVVTLDTPVYLDRRGDLWLTHPQGKPVAEVLADAFDQRTHVVNEPVSYVHWAGDGKGGWVPHVVIAGDGDAFDLVTPQGREKRTADGGAFWQNAYSLRESIVVPTGTGLMVLTHDPATHAYTAESVPVDGEQRTISVVDFTGRLIAWSPGGGAAMRQGDAGWTPLQNVVGATHLVPLADGTLMVLNIAEDDALDLQTVFLDGTTAQVDRAAIERLVQQLADRQPKARQEALDALSAYGPSAWPVLMELAQDAPPAAKLAIRQLTSDATRPTLAGLRVRGGPTRIVTRLSDGGLVLHLQFGIEVPALPGVRSSRLIAPAWLAFRPGRAVQLLSAPVAAELSQMDLPLWAWGTEWVVGDRLYGPRRLMGNHLMPILPESQRKQFPRFAGIDGSGRWLFRPAEQDTPVLLLDPGLPSPATRLPTLVFPFGDKPTGWDDQDWPAVHGGSVWRLNASGWAVSETKADAADIADLTATPQPATLAGRTFTARAEALTDAAGVTLPLPDEALGTMGNAWLVATQDRLWLMNSPGTLVCLKLENDQLVLDGIFTRNIPTTPKRLWVDPAGRIAIVNDGNIVLSFPDGRVPSALSTLLP